MYCKTRAQGFGAEVKRRILIGTYVLSHGYYDAYYLKAQKIRRLIAQDFAEAFKQCDLIMGPTSPTVAFALGAKVADPVQMYLNDIYTIAGEPRRPAGDVDSLRLRRGRPAGRAADRRQLFRRGADARASRTSTSSRPTGICASRRRGLSVAAMDWEIVIGLETHAQLSTASKIFSGAATAVRRGAQRAGLRGGHRAARRAAGAEPGRGRARDPLRPRGGRRRSAAARCSRARTTSIPTCPRATRSASTNCRSSRAARSRSSSTATREDACGSRARTSRRTPARSLHEDFHGMSGIDLNRAGTPLLEIVSEPDMRSAEEAVAYAQGAARAGALDRHLRRQHAGRVVPLRRQRLGAPRRARPLGTRREIKNLNSFRFLEQAIEYEVRRQIELLEDGGKIEQATRLFDPDTRRDARRCAPRRTRTTTATSPIPDLLPLAISRRMDRGRSKRGMPELPQAKRERYRRSSRCRRTTRTC